MSYKKWNTALIDHFFYSNDNQEVILYCDEDVINEIGQSKRLGKIEDFLNQVILEEKRTEIYDSYFYDRRSNLSVEINRKIKNYKGLKFSLLLFEKGLEKKVSLSYFSFIITSILKHVLTEDRKKHLGINNIGNNPSGFDDLFFDIQNNYSNFIARKIGKLRYEGLIKFQVVLNRNENSELDKILFDKNLQFSEDESYESILNRVIRYSNGSLRKKLEQSISDECYKIWFENKIKHFNIEKYCRINNVEKQSTLEGEFALALILQKEFKGLKLLTNVNPKENLSNGVISINNTFIHSRLENGFFIDTVNLNTKVEIKEYSFEEKEKNISINSLKLNDVILLQEFKSGVFIQTINPYPNTYTYILVKNENKIAENFKVWCKDKEIEIEEINTSDSHDLIGDSHLIFSSESFHIPYYKIDKSNYFKVDDNLIQVKKFGGFKPSGTLNTYLDVSLPQFKFQINDFDESKFKVEFLRIDLSGKKDKENFDFIIKDNVASIFIKNPDFHFDSIFIEVNFHYDGNQIGSFDFGIEASIMKKPDDEKDFIKLNKWGAETTDKPYYNIKTLEGANKVELKDTIKQEIKNLEEKGREHADYLINLICAAFNKTDKNYLDKQQLKHIYESSLTFLNTVEDAHIEENEYSLNNLLKYLLELGFLQKQIISSKDVYLPISPTFSKIEKSFTTGGSQVYLLTGLYSRSFIFELKSFTTAKGIKIKYRKLNGDKSRLAESYLLPDLIFIDANFSIEDFRKNCDENKLHFETETKHNVPYSLLNFVASIDDFENDFLNLNLIDNASNDQEKIKQYYSDLEPAKESDFPRLRVLKSDKVYLKKTKFFEFKENEFLKISNEQDADWLDIYIKYKRKQPFIIFEKNPSKVYYSDIFIYRYVKLPHLLSKVLALMNTGVPSEQKLFIVNSSLNERSKEFAFNVFLKYTISDLSSELKRRKQIAKTLTGNEEIEGNKQIIDSIRNSNSKITMELYQPKNKKHLDSFILIKDMDEVIAFVRLGNDSKPKTVLVNKTLIQKSDTITDSKLTIKKETTSIPNTSSMISVVLKNNNMNTIISTILKNKIKDLSLSSTYFSMDVLLEEYNKENIKIIDNY